MFHFTGRRRVSTSIVLLVGGLSIASLTLNTVWSPHQLNWSSWAFYEWLINYHGGFVRRGLVGELVERFSAGDELQAVNRLVFVCGMAYMLLSLVQALSLKGRAALLYVLAPTGIFWVALSNEHYYRKEVLFYCAVLLVTTLYRSWSARATALKKYTILAVIGLSSLVFPFIHEGYVFCCLIPFSMVLWRLSGTGNDDRPHARAVTSWFIAFNLLVFLVMCAFKGGLQYRDAVWASLSDEAKQFSGGGQHLGGIDSLGWSVKTGLLLSVRLALSGLGSYFLFPLALVYLIVGYIQGCRLCQGTLAVYRDSRFVATFMLIVAGFLPLFMMGWDWGRWVVGIFIAFSSMAFSDLLLPASIIERFKPVLKPGAAHALLFAGLLALSLFTRTPECCIQSIGGSWVNNRWVDAAWAHLKKPGP